MNISLHNRSRERGSALIISLTLGVILLVVVSSYLMLLSSQKNLVTRSQTWNGAMTMAEAGIEEGLAQLNASNGVFIIGTTATNSNLGGNNWGVSVAGSIYGPKTVNLLGGSYAAIIKMDATPTIYSTGYATVPIVGGIISRAVEVTTAQQPLINVPLGARLNINFNGNGIATDSYDSTKTNLSTNGQYDSSKTSTNGSVASVGGIVDLGNHTIEGNLYLGPTASYTGNGTVTGSIDYNFNVQFPDVQLPAGANSWSTAAPTSVTTTAKNGKKTTSTYFDFTTSGNYILNTDAYPIYVEPGVTVNLNVTSTSFNPTDLEIHGGTTNSGTAVLYLNGPTSVSIAGNSAVDASNQPKNLWYFGLPTLTSITFSGTSSFNGVIYAPEASMTLNGGGNNIGITGAAIVGNITMNGHYNFHYDESLAKWGPTRGYVATSWQELY